MSLLFCLIAYVFAFRMNVETVGGGAGPEWQAEQREKARDYELSYESFVVSVVSLAITSAGTISTIALGWRQDRRDGRPRRRSQRRRGG